MADRVLLLGHGTVDNLEDLPAFLANIRHGRPSPPELVQEIRRHYDLIGGSPLLWISRELARGLERKLECPVHLAMRFWYPFAKDVLGDISRAGCRTLRVVPLAPYSGPVYASEMERLANAQRKEGLEPPALRCAANWGREPRLVEAFSTALLAALSSLPADRRASAEVFFTAHSLPLPVVERGYPYPAEVRATADAVIARSGMANPSRVVYQSQGATADPWLGPALRESLLDAAKRGTKDVVFCPIGFLSDHIEILYDLDIEAKAWAHETGIDVTRTPSLNASPGLVDAIAAVANGL